MRLLLGLSVVCLIACGDAVTEPAAPAAEQQPPASIQFVVAGMNCQGCVNAIENQVEMLDGVADCRVTFQNGGTGPAVVVYDHTKVDVQAIKDAVLSLNKFSITEAK